MIDVALQQALVLGLLAPFIIVGVGVSLGLILSVANVMLAVTLGILEIFAGRDDE